MVDHEGGVRRVAWWTIREGEKGGDMVDYEGG